MINDKLCRGQEENTVEKNENDQCLIQQTQV